MHFKCPPGTRWNEHVSTCDHQANVNCRARGLVPVRHPGFWAGFATMNLHAGDYSRYRAYHNSRLRASYVSNYHTGAAQYNTGYKHPYRRHKFYARINSYKGDDKYSPLIRNPPNDVGLWRNETERVIGVQPVDVGYRAKYQPKREEPIEMALPIRPEELWKTWNKQTRFSYWAKTESYPEPITTTQGTPGDVQTEQREKFQFQAGFLEEENEEKESETFVDKQFGHLAEDQSYVASSSQIPQRKTSDADSKTDASQKSPTTTVQNERKMSVNVSRGDHSTTVNYPKTTTQNDSQTTKTRPMVHNVTIVMINNQTSKVTRGGNVNVALNQSLSPKLNHSKSSQPMIALNVTANVTQSQPNAESQTNLTTQNHTVSVTQPNTTQVTHTETSSVAQNQTITVTKNNPKSTVQNQTTTKFRNETTTKVQSQKTITTIRREINTTQHRTQSMTQNRTQSVTKEEPITTTLK